MRRNLIVKASQREACCTHDLGAIRLGTVNNTITQFSYEPEYECQLLSGHAASQRRNSDWLG